MSKLLFIHLVPISFILLPPKICLELRPIIFSPTTMFPNDDICNVDAAKQAAQRLFRRYRNRGGEGGLGNIQVNRLMKATYEAINLRIKCLQKAYDPNEQDVSSFISVFDSNNQGSIQLQDLEEMAVKYLCGTEALLKDLAITKSSSPQKRQNEKKREKQEDPPVQEQQSVKVQKIQDSEPKLEPKTQKSWKKLTIEVSEESTPQRVYTPSLSYKPPPIASFYSPKRPSFKDSLPSPTTEATSFHSELPTPKQKLTQSQVRQRGREIFSNNGGGLGISEASAGRVLGETYEMFGKRGFVPSGEDVRIWMKLCDKNKDGVVEWEDYEYFLMRTFERENTVQLQKKP